MRDFNWNYAISPFFIFHHVPKGPPLANWGQPNVAFKQSAVVVVINWISQISGWGWSWTKSSVFVFRKWRSFNFSFVGFYQIYFGFSLKEKCEQDQGPNNGALHSAPFNALCSTDRRWISEVKFLYTLLHYHWGN